MFILIIRLVLNCVIIWIIILLEGISAEGHKKGTHGIKIIKTGTRGIKNISMENDSRILYELVMSSFIL